MKNLKKNGGFTLVELIVVIAILAILAAVAVPAYSGYIEKANKAGDETLLATVNRAFSSACLENNLNQYVDISAASIPVDANGVIGAESFPTADAENIGTPKFISALKLSDGTPLSETALIAFNKSFAIFYAGNETASFKTVKSATLNFNPATGMFELDEITVGGLFGKVFETLGDAISGSVSSVKDSAFGDIGATELLNKVSNVTDLSNKIALGDGEVEANKAYQDFLMSGMQGLMLSMGYDPVEMDRLANSDDPDDQKKAAEMDAEFGALWNQMIADKAAKDNMSPEDATYTLLTNYAVLSAAKNTNQTVSAADLAASINSGELASGTLKKLMKDEDATTAQQALGDAAMVYGMYTAWANSLPDSDTNKEAAMQNASTIDGFISDMANPEFLAYMQGDTAQKDLDGYRAAMDIINKAGDGNSDAVSELLVNGFDDPSLLAALEDLLK